MFASTKTRFTSTNTPGNLWFLLFFFFFFFLLLLLLLLLLWRFLLLVMLLVMAFLLLVLVPLWCWWRCWYCCWCCGCWWRSMQKQTQDFGRDLCWETCRPAGGWSRRMDQAMQLKVPGSILQDQSIVAAVGPSTSDCGSHAANQRAQSLWGQKMWSLTLVGKALGPLVSYS